MDFADPDGNIEGIAAGLGARTEKIGGRAVIGDALGRALAHAGPSVPVIDREP
jgi:hypothetical protein